MLIIAAVVCGMAFMGMQGSKSNAHGARARAVALSLGEAIQQFQRDHGGRPPAQPGSVDWNAGWTSPIDRTNGDRPYVKTGSVEPLVAGAVAVANRRGATLAAGARAGSRIHYFDDPTRGRYALVVYVRRGTTWRAECFVSGNQRADLQALIGSTGVRRTC